MSCSCRCLKKSARMVKSQAKYFSVRSEDVNVKLKNPADKHMYKRLFPWSSLDKFSDILMESVIYNHGGLIAINKPYGVPIYSKSHDENDRTQSKQITTANFAHSGDPHYSIEDTLPILKSKLKVDNLAVVKGAERYSSGITLLASSKTIASSIQKSILRCKPMKHFCYKYWLVTQGLPTPQSGTERLAMEFLQIAEDDKQPIIHRKFSSTSIKLQRMMPMLVDYRPVSYNKNLDAAVLQVSVSSNKRHFVRLFASHKAIRLIGDHMYGCRVKEVLGKFVCLSPQNAASREFTPLSARIMKCLKLPSKIVSNIPSHLHLHQVSLPSFLGPSKSLLLTAPPPEYFLWTCHQLELLPNKERKTTASVESGMTHQQFYPLEKEPGV